MQNGESFLGEKPLKIAHGLNFTPKIIPDGEGAATHRLSTDYEILSRTVSLITPSV